MTGDRECCEKAETAPGAGRGKRRQAGAAGDEARAAVLEARSKGRGSGARGGTGGGTLSLPPQPSLHQPAGGEGHRQRSTGARARREARTTLHLPGSRGRPAGYSGEGRPGQARWPSGSCAPGALQASAASRDPSSSGDRQDAAAHGACCPPRQDTGAAARVVRAHGGLQRWQCLSLSLQC